MYRWILPLLVVLGVAGCSQSAPITPAERGRRIYLSSCVVCHNPDPTKPGAAGPEVAGASPALLEARVVHASYPPGYTPKRPTKAMVALPHLAPYIDDLAAFLATRQGEAR